MKTALLLLVLLPSLPFPSDGKELPGQPNILGQNGSPVKITKYRIWYQTLMGNVDHGVNHKLAFENVSGRKIMAIRFGLYSFNIFKELQYRLGGEDTRGIEIGETSIGRWASTGTKRGEFHTGIAFVSKIRFENGEIWELNVGEVVDQIRKFTKDDGFSAESLKPPPREGGEEKTLKRTI